jgi:2-dehydro-3-deoxyphosphogluconate aldolase/(4S)-4-hydroxy-2-oxoglutarate aldolase
MTADPFALLQRIRVVPLIVIDDARNAASLAMALSMGGLPCAEIAFRTPAAGEALRRLTSANADILAGAGTVLTPEQAAEARDAGAQFIVSPGFNPRVVDYCQDHDIPIYPGVCTPTEVEAALEKGLTTLKFFPAEAMGGVETLKAISAPYSAARFIPTGGLNGASLPSYLALKSVVACGGSWMAPRDWIAAGEFDRIRGEVERTVSTVRQITAG